MESKAKQEAERIILIHRTPLAFTASKAEIFLETEIGKSHAIKHVEGIIDVLDNEGYDDKDSKIIHWQEVKQELNKKL